MTGEPARRAYLAPTLLRPEHVIDDFHCASEELTSWLTTHARSSSGGGFTKVFVVTEVGSRNVVGYYAWTMAAVLPPNAPPRVTHGGGLHPVPVALLARLAVDTRHEGGGIGSSMLRDVVTRAATVGSGIGCRGLLVHCENSAARQFYTNRIPDFVPSPSDPLHLYLLMKTMRALGA